MTSSRLSLSFVLLCTRRFFSEIAQGSMYFLWLPQCWQSLNKFCKSVIEIFGDEVLGFINTIKKHTLEIFGQYLKNTTPFGSVVSSHSSLMPFKIMYTKLMGIATADCEKNGFDERAFICSCCHFLI